MPKRHRIRVGQTSGKWTVLEIGRRLNGGEPASLCECSCGTQRVVLNWRIANRYATCCGKCARRAKPYGLAATARRDAIVAYVASTGITPYRMILTRFDIPQGTLDAYLKFLVTRHQLVRTERGVYATPGTAAEYQPDAPPPVPPPTQAGRLAAIDAIPPAMAGRPS